ncbi:MAG: TonB-dependent receptor [Myxococcota bacterium]
MSFHCALIVQALLAQTPPDDAVTDVESVVDFSLEALLETEFETATKTKRSLREVASIVEVVTATQIRQRGYRHLADVLNDLPNYHEDRSNWGIGEPTFQNVGFGYRFDTGQNYLLLFNGQRLNAFLPGNQFGGEKYVLESVERIEIVRGPGSALYGANAFTGVVNIVSKQSIEDYAAMVSVGGIAPSSGAYVQAQVSTPVGEEGFFGAAFRYETEQGQRILVENDLFGDAEIRDGIRYSINGDAMFTWRNLRVYASTTTQSRDAFTGFNGVSPDGNDDLSLFMYGHSLGADFELSLDEGLTLVTQAGVHFDNWTEVALIPLFQVNAAGDGLVLDADGLPILDPVPVRRDGQDLVTPFVIDGQGADTVTVDGEVRLKWEFSPEHFFVTGINVIHDRVVGAERPSELQISPFAVESFQTFTDADNNWLFDLDATRTTIGVFAQADYELVEGLFIDGGVRGDVYAGTGELDETFTSISPRVGLVGVSDTLGSFKALYGRSTRVPNGFETLSSVTILGDPENRPETLDMFQLLWLKTWSDTVTTELGGFHSLRSDPLTTDADISDELRAQGFIGQFRNIDTDERLSTTGVDGKFTARLLDATVTLNFTRFLTTNDGAGSSIAYIPRTLINGRINIPLWIANLNLGANYRGDFSTLADDSRERVPDYMFLSATAIVAPESWPFEFRLGLRNALDRDIRYPSSSLDFPRGFPSRGISVWGELTYRL